MGIEPNRTSLQELTLVFDISFEYICEQWSGQQWQTFFHTTKEPQKTEAAQNDGCSGENLPDLEYNGGWICMPDQGTILVKIKFILLHLTSRLAELYIVYDSGLILTFFSKFLTQNALE